MQLRKKVWVVMLVYLIGFQPKVKGDEIFDTVFALLMGCSLAVLVLIFCSPGQPSNNMPRVAQNTSGLESLELRQAKSGFMRKLKLLDLKDQYNWTNNCYCHFFNKNFHDDSAEKIERFIAEQERCAPNKLQIFGNTLTLPEREKSLFLGVTNIIQNNSDGKYFVDYAWELLEQYRRNQTSRFIGVCCAAYPCEYGIETDIASNYPGILASQIFTAFTKASGKDAINYGNLHEEQQLITKDLLFICINQVKKR